jgi:hypothetical protein
MLVALVLALCPASLARAGAAPPPQAPATAPAEAPAKEAPAEAAPVKAIPVRQQFVELYAAKDAEKCAELWRANPAAILQAIDEDLEGSLAAWEQSREAPDEVAIRIQQERALWGARIASDATGHPIFLDYASAFAGFDDKQKASFRAGQMAHSESRRALGGGDKNKALELARKCCDIALPLGDWWGYAMGLEAGSMAQLALKQHAGAAADSARAAVIYRDLGLVANEASCWRIAAEGLLEQGCALRAHAATVRALALVEPHDSKRKTTLLELRLRAEEALGRADEAAKTRAELSAPSVPAK